MRKVIYLLLFLSLSLFAKIDEYKSDLYYANGIMMNISEKEATKVWSSKVKELFANNQKDYKQLEKIQNSYNRSQGFFDDLFESLEQKISNEFGWKELSAYVTSFLTTHNIQEDWKAHVNDLSKQVANYKKSITSGHGVIVIAHSQGNYYTNEAYEELDDWMKEYFHMFGVATPANHVAGFAVDDTTAPYVKFHNDFIKSVVGGLASNMDDPNSDHNNISIDAHDFYDSYLASENSREKIVNFIQTKIQEQVEKQSQWAVDENSDEGTKKHRITVKHIYDDSITIDEEIYPFAPKKKIYQVDDLDGGKSYVKASFGGEQILDKWEGQKKEEQFYKLEGTDPIEYIISDRFIRDEDEDIVYDTYNNLYWQDTSSTWLDGWQGANRYCQDLLLGDYDDWRLPTLDELKSIYNFDKNSAPAGEVRSYEVFKYLGAVGYWSSDILVDKAAVLSYGNSGITYWEIDIPAGRTTPYKMNTRCVR